MTDNVNPAFTVNSMGKRAQAAAQLLLRHYTAEVVVSLATGKAPASGFEPAEGRKPVTPVGEIAMKPLSEFSSGQRRKMARQLIRRDPSTGQKRTPQERLFFERVLKADPDTPMIKRTNLMSDLVQVLNLDQKPTERDNDAARARRLLAETLPTQPSDVTTVTSAIFTHNRLQFVVERVFCADETGEWGADEIGFTGTATVAPEPTANPAYQLNVEPAAYVDAGSFRSNDIRNFAPNEVMYEWDLTTQDDNSYFCLLFLMAELDRHGGLLEYRQELADSLEDRAAEIRNAFAIGGALGWTVGGILAVTFAVLASFLTILVGLVLGILAGVIYLLTRNYDDMFDPALFAIQLNEDTLMQGGFTAAGRSRSTTTRLMGSGGTYDVTHYWQLLDPVS